MARGYPDYNNPFFSIAAHSVDFAQLMAFMSGIRTVDNLGFLLDVENWKEGLSAWELGYDAAGRTPHVFTGRCEVPPFSMRSSFVGGGGFGTMYIKKTWANLLNSRMGIEFSILIDAIFPRLTIQIEQQDGLTAWRFSARVDYNQKLVETKIDAAWQTLATYPFSSSGYYFVPLKFVWDYDTTTLVRWIIGGNRYDIDLLSGELVTYVSSTQKTTLTLSAEDITYVAQNITIGHVFTTIDEP
jgi:hypothetical protein